MKAGGEVIATGPTGHYDERARAVAKPWLAGFGAEVELVEPERAGAFPPGANLKPDSPVAECRWKGEGWFTSGKLRWRAGRLQKPEAAAALVAALKAGASPAVPLEGLPAEWRTRQFRDGARVLIHALPSKVEVLFHPKLEKRSSHERVIEKLKFTPLAGELKLRAPAVASKVTLHSPDLAAPRAGVKNADGAWTVSLAGVSRYFVVECA
jgi:hypothetical protein